VFVLAAAAVFFEPSEPASNLIIGANCCTVPTIFWTFCMVLKMPSMPPIRSMISFRSARFGRPPGLAAPCAGISPGYGTLCR